MTFRSLKVKVVGEARNIKDPHVFHMVSLGAFLAWVGLGADGLSSSAYGPDEAYRATGMHAHLVLFLIPMMAITIAVISTAYANLIQNFPSGGGGYLVATRLLGARVGVVSGCALLVDYVLTIATSVASGVDQLCSFLPAGLHAYKVSGELAVLLVLVVLNLRGIKESVKILMPIVVTFVAVFAFSILYAIFSKLPAVPGVVADAGRDFHSSVATLGLIPVLMIIVRAYSMGAGTYTGIEAVSNGVSMLREPRVRTAWRTMAFMAFSLAFTAGGIMFAYLLTGAQPRAGKTMNAVMLENLFGAFHLGGVPAGMLFVGFALIASAVILFVAAQTGFLDGPRVLANMAVDSWMPHSFAQLSERLVTNNGIYLMGLASAAVLLYTHGDITMLITMYSINVFVTFSLSLLGMAKYTLQNRRNELHWFPLFALHSFGLLMCLSILTLVIYEKFMQGGWMTLIVTSLLVFLALGIRKHYASVDLTLESLDAIKNVPPIKALIVPPPVDRMAPTAVVLVKSYSGLGIHGAMSVLRTFPSTFRHFVFASGAIVDSAHFKDVAELERLELETRAHLERYVAWALSQGLSAEYRLATGTDPVETIETLAASIAEEFPRAVFFMGKLIFKEEKWYQRLLHNETPAAIQRRLQFDGLQAIILPIRV